MGMFDGLESQKRKALIFLYEQYIAKGNLDDHIELLEEVVFDAGYSVFSKDVIHAAANIEKAVTKELSVEEAKMILKKIKPPIKTWKA